MENQKNQLKNHLKNFTVKELKKEVQGLINLKNEDNECFRWCHIRHLNPQDKNPQRIKNLTKIC